MTDEATRYARVQALLAEALDLPGDQRGRFLDQACAGDPALRAEVDELLALTADDDGDALLGERALEDTRRALDGAVDGALVARDGEWIPERIGHYRVLGKLGQGGMGVVYEAEQSSPHRRVAIKLLHPMLATPDRLRRFRQEAAVLGRLTHPGIAQVFESGTADTGRGEQSFLVMELVEGRDLRSHCERQGLDLRARAALLAEVAEAVHHAHEHGVVHRDLKPDNVLVDAHGRPRILDFGIARVEGGSATLSTIVTEEGQLVGTLAYMAPEQLEPARGGATRQVDVYALGVLGFELLVGRLPHDVADLSLSQAITLLTTRDVPRSGRLAPALRGDLETILGKALEPDTGRRYPSAAAFAADLRRHLDHRPILARPPSGLYRARKFTRRHRGLVAGAVATLVTLVAGLAVSLALADEAQQQRDVATEQAAIASANERRALHGVLQSAGTLSAVGRPRDALRQLWLVPHEQRGVTWWLLERQGPHLVESEQGFWDFLDEDHLVLGGDEGVLVYSLTEQRVIRELLRDELAGQARTLLDVTPAGLALSYHSPERDVLLLDLGHERVLASWPLPLVEEQLPARLFLGDAGQEDPLGTERVPRLRPPQVSDDGRTVLRYTTGTVAEVRRDDELLRRVEGLGALETLRLGPDGRLLALNRRDEVTVVDLETGALRFRHAPDPDEGAYAVPVRGGVLLHSMPDIYQTGLRRTLRWASERRVWRRVELPATGGTVELDDPFRTGWRLDAPLHLTPLPSFTPDGGRLALSGVHDPNLGARLVDPTTGEPLAAAVLGPGPDGRGGWLSYAEADGQDGRTPGSRTLLSPDGRRVAVVHRLEPATVVELDARPESGVLTLRGHAGADGAVADGWIYHLAVSHDGSLLASAAPLDPFVRVWDVRTGEILARLERGPCVAQPYGTGSYDAFLAFTPDDERLVLTTPYEGSDPRVVSWDLATGTVDLPSAPVANPGDHTLALLEAFLDAARPGPRERLGQRAHTLDGEAWVGLHRPNGSWFGERPEPGPRWRYVPARGEVAGIAVHPERPHVAFVRNAHHWSVGTVESHRIYALSDEPGATDEVTRRELLVVLDAVTGERLVERALDAQPWCAAYSPDGAVLAVGTHQGRVLFFETGHHEQQLDWPAHDSYVYSLAWTPDGTRLVTASGDATLRVWDSRPRIVARREDDAWRALRASLAEREDLAAVYPMLEGDERAAARAELMRRRNGG